MIVLISDVLFNFLTYIESLRFESEPDYEKCRAMFKDALKKAKHPMVSRFIRIKDCDIDVPWRHRQPLSQ